MGMLDSIISNFQAKSNGGKSTQNTGQQPQGNQPTNTGNNSGGNFTPSNNSGNMGFQNGNDGQNNAQTANGGATIPGNGENNQGNNGNSNANQPKKEPHPMDRFGNIFDNSAKQDAAPSFRLDRKVVKEVAAKQNFYDGIDPQLMAQADGGDVKAMREVQRLAMENVYSLALEHAGTLTDNFVGQREQFGEKSFGKKVKSHMTAASMAAHPAMKNPVVRQQMNETAERLAKQHQDASPEEIKEMTMDYFKQLGELFGEKKEGEGDAKPQGDADFADWFGDTPMDASAHGKKDFF